MNIISCLFRFNLIIPSSSAAMPKIPIPYLHSLKTHSVLRNVCQNF